MNVNKRIASAAFLTAALAAVSYGHLPSVYDASLKMGRTGGEGRNSRADAVVTYSNKGEWKSTETYRGDYTIAQGDTVSYGTFNGKKLWWWAKFFAKGDELKPGYFAPQGGTSPWVLINSLSAVGNGTVNYQWKGWNGQMESMSGVSADIPTWRDGAEGAYTFTHDDIGAMPFDLSVKPGWDLAKEYPDIKQCWGIYVEKMNEPEWSSAIEMVLEGHEMFNHSMKHTSAADQWQWFRPGQVVPTHDPAIPESIRGLTVVGTWGDPSKEPAYPYNGDGTMMFESPLVAIRSTHYWTQNAPTSEVPGTDLGSPYGIVIEPEIHAKDGVEEITLPTGQKQYVKYTKRDTTGQGFNEGFIAATGATWMEAAELDQYGGQFWQPDVPYSTATPVEWSWSAEWQFTAGQIISYQGNYYRVKATGQGTDTPDKDATKYEAMPGFDPNNPVLDTNGTYVGEKWSSSTPNVAADKGAPAFVAKVFCVAKWEGPEYKLNIQDANDTINKNLYGKIITAGEHFRKGKRSEYFGYPFDAYSEVTHDSLEQAGFVGARGGAKSGRPIPGDFFHPYRIDFDAFYITRDDWNPTSQGAGYTYPDNPHVLLGLNEMVDRIVDSKGYMIREFHAVADIADGAWYDNSAPSEQWPLNSAAKGVGGWWGGITTNQLKQHYDYVQDKIDAKKLTIYTVGEVTKYRMTANAADKATLTQSGSNYNLSVSIKAGEEGLAEKYHDEISVIVSLADAADSLNVVYKTVDPEWGASPRRRPVKMDDTGKRWSISINPFLGAAEIVPNAEWTGQGIEIETGAVAVDNTPAFSVNRASFIGIRDGQIALTLPVGKAYRAELFSAMGRKVGSVRLEGSSNIVRTGLATDALGAGIYYLNVTANGSQVIPTAKVLVK